MTRQSEVERERDRYRKALEQIAYHEPQEDEQAEAMRRTAREALNSLSAQEGR